VESVFCFFFSSRRRHTRFDCDWSSDVCSSDLAEVDADLAADLLVDLDHELGVLGQEVLGVLLALPELLAVVRVPGARLVHDAEEIGRASCRDRVWMWWGVVLS